MMRLARILDDKDGRLIVEYNSSRSAHLIAHELARTAIRVAQISDRPMRWTVIGNGRELYYGVVNPTDVAAHPTDRFTEKQVG